MKPTILLFLLFGGFAANAQTIINHEVESKGVYKEINLSNDIRVIKLLLDTNFNTPRENLIDSVELRANYYTPPVLYALSNILFFLKRSNEATYWFYVAQLRARYDVNRCADKTANAEEYNQNFGPVINNYALTHLDTLEKIIPRVVEFVRSNEERYDQRWINLTGMDAMSAGLDDKPIYKKLSLDKSKWPAIKTKTIDDYYSGFKEALAGFRKK
jgi:hypothetical protein